MINEKRIGQIVIEKLWDEGLIVDSHTRGRIEAYCSLYHLSLVLGAHVNPGDEERLQRYRTLMQKVEFGALTPSWAHWYLLVWYRWPPTLRPDDFVRVVNATSMIFAGWTDVPYKLEVLTKIIDAGTKFGYENHACMPERAANDETLVQDVAEAHAVNYF